MCLPVSLCVRVCIFVRAYVFVRERQIHHGAVLLTQRAAGVRCATYTRADNWFLSKLEALKVNIGAS